MGSLYPMETNFHWGMSDEWRHMQARRCHDLTPTGGWMLSVRHSQATVRCLLTMWPMSDGNPWG
ncbi:hypothetical protein PAXRUDRAFT_374734 [Paxillus rubicundulus Ve08.2h10]|uniref:Unplaced genomic scaffold scaffold_2124, whole genome shotgun sequence n=1 Tax=Paxillus rubicundulus Ve08.2h10 TaxID=930991 RepID=A0A0D0DAJ2_9AGAM|nr:hypothetical protein PAXRUDRAFT_374734 [Paxillus rubicundulus Ve08.2h10]